MPSFVTQQEREWAQQRAARDAAGVAYDQMRHPDEDSWSYRFANLTANARERVAEAKLAAHQAKLAVRQAQTPDARQQAQLTHEQAELAVHQAKSDLQRARVDAKHRIKRCRVALRHGQRWIRQAKHDIRPGESFPLALQRIQGGRCCPYCLLEREPSERVCFFCKGPLPPFPT